MKKISIGLALALTPVAAQASPALYELCGHYQRFAEAVMATRQDGSSIKEALDIVKNEDFSLIVLDAYDSPNYMGVEPFTSNAVTEHGNKWMIKCLRGELEQ